MSHTCDFDFRGSNVFSYLRQFFVATVVDFQPGLDAKAGTVGRLTLEIEEAGRVGANLGDFVVDA